jgi:Archaeal holliday junction resolvase (hjc)
MTLHMKNPTAGGAAGLEIASLPGGIDCASNAPETVPAQAKKRGGRTSRDKGNRLERAIVKLLQEHGLGAERIPLSGSVGGSFSGDVTAPLIGRDLTIECKSRANGFARLYSWLEDRDVLIVKADRRDALVVLPLHLAAEIAAAAERGKP